MRNPLNYKESYINSFAVFLILCLAVSVAPVSAAVTRAQIKDVSGDIICYCGCENKVVATCGCGTADKIEVDIARQLEEGQTKEEIIAAYVATHGEKGLAAPTTSGFNLTAWLMPIFAFLAGGLIIRTAVVRWRRHGRETESHRKQTETPSASDVKHQNRILEELEEWD